jgi:hypothetical protein
LHRRFGLCITEVKVNPPTLGFLLLRMVWMENDSDVISMWIIVVIKQDIMK